MQEIRDIVEEQGKIEVQTPLPFTSISYTGAHIQCDFGCAFNEAA